MARKASTADDVVRFGRIELPVFDPPQHEDFVPDRETFIDPYGYAERLACAWERGWDVALLGPTGVGKTALVRHMCGQTGRAYRRFPCFAAGTMVLTELGFRPIEDIAAGERVVTHKGRLRRVVRTMQREASSTILVRGTGFPEIRTTDEHPFYSREITGREKSGPRTFGDCDWRDAAALRPGKDMLVQVLPGGTGTEPPDLPSDVLPEQAADFYWLVGRYLADGWRRADGKAVIVCAGYHEERELSERIDRVVHATRSPEPTTTKFIVSRVEWHSWLAPFGDGAGDKRLPVWVYGLPAELQNALLDGYLSGDGNRVDTGHRHAWRFSTSSKALALGFALLAHSARGIVAGVYEIDPPPTGVIEGRKISQQRYFQVWIHDRNRSSFVEADYGYKLFRESEESTGARVYNLEVEVDNSYVAEGCVVHNCQEATDTAALLGKPWITVEEASGRQEMVFQRGIAYDAVLEQHVLLLDEWNLAHPDVQMAINPLFRVDEGMLIVTENEGEVVQRGEDFRLVATGNPTTYAGVKAWNPAVLSRFDMVIWMTYLPERPETELLVSQTGVEERLASCMVKAAAACRNAVNDSTLRFPLSYRELRNWSGLLDVFGVRDSAEIAVVGKAELDDQEAVRQLLRASFPAELWT